MNIGTTEMNHDMNTGTKHNNNKNNISNHSNINNNNQNYSQMDSSDGLSVSYDGTRSRNVSALPTVDEIKRAKNKIFIGGLPWNTREQHLYHYFKQYGEILHVDCKIDRETERCRGFGFVTFENPGSVLDVLRQKTLHRINDKTIDPKLAESPKVSAKIFIGGLRAETDENILRNYFKRFGRIRSIERPFDKNLNRSKGFAFVTYEEDIPEISSIFQEKYHEIDGKRCEVKEARNGVSTGYRDGPSSHGNSNYQMPHFSGIHHNDLATIPEPTPGHIGGIPGMNVLNSGQALPVAQPVNQILPQNLNMSLNPPNTMLNHGLPMTIADALNVQHLTLQENTIPINANCNNNFLANQSLADNSAEVVSTQPSSLGQGTATHETEQVVEKLVDDNENNTEKQVLDERIPEVSESNFEKNTSNNLQNSSSYQNSSENRSNGNSIASTSEPGTTNGMTSSGIHTSSTSHQTSITEAAEMKATNNLNLANNNSQNPINPVPAATTSVPLLSTQLPQTDFSKFNDLVLAYYRQLGGPIPVNQELYTQVYRYLCTINKTQIDQQQQLQQQQLQQQQLQQQQAIETSSDQKNENKPINVQNTVNNFTINNNINQGINNQVQNLGNLLPNGQISSNFNSVQNTNIQQQQKSQEPNQQSNQVIESQLSLQQQQQHQQLQHQNILLANYINESTNTLGLQVNQINPTPQMNLQSPNLNSNAFSLHPEIIQNNQILQNQLQQAQALGINCPPLSTAAVNNTPTDNSVNILENQTLPFETVTQLTQQQLLMNQNLGQSNINSQITMQPILPTATTINHPQIGLQNLNFSHLTNNHNHLQSLNNQQQQNLQMLSQFENLQIRRNAGYQVVGHNSRGNNRRSTSGYHNNNNNGDSMRRGGNKRQSGYGLQQRYSNKNAPINTGYQAQHQSRNSYPNPDRYRNTSSHQGTNNRPNSRYNNSRNNSGRYSVNSTNNNNYGSNGNNDSNNLRDASSSGYYSGSVSTTNKTSSYHSPKTGYTPRYSAVNGNGNAPGETTNANIQNLVQKSVTKIGPGTPHSGSSIATNNINSNNNIISPQGPVKEINTQNSQDSSTSFPVLVSQKNPLVNNALNNQNLINQNSVNLSYSNILQKTQSQQSVDNQNQGILTTVEQNYNNNNNNSSTKNVNPQIRKSSTNETNQPSHNRSQNMQRRESFYRNNKNTEIKTGYVPRMNDNG